MGKTQARELIQSSVSYIEAAAVRLQASKFSETAIERFRSNISGTLRRSGDALVAMAWLDGNGSGEAPFEIARRYHAEQMHFLEGWLSEIQQAGKLVGGVGRAALYGESLGQVYQRAFVMARGSRVGLPELPAYPRDGSTECRVRCRCQWRIVERSRGEVYDAFWQLGQAEHCPTCIERGREWNPLRLLKVRDEWLRLDTAGRPV